MSMPLFSGNNGGASRNLLMTTSASNTENALLLAVLQCLWKLHGRGAQPWDYVVACYDGCAAPEATYTTIPDCDNNQFRIAVEVTSLGSASSASITNDAGAASVDITTAGTYHQTGPFPWGRR